MKRCALFLLCTVLLSAQEKPAPVVVSAEPGEEILRPHETGRFKALFQPFRTNTAALSPDGKYIAYSIREGETLSVVVIEIDHPEVIKARVNVVNDTAATPILDSQQWEKTPGRINWMRWISPTRVVVETNSIFAKAMGTEMNWQSWRGAVLAFDVDGTNAKQLASPEDLPEYSEADTKAFSVARDRTPLQNTPDQSPSVEDLTDFSSPDASSLDPDAPTESSPAVGSGQPRSLKVFDFDPNRPGGVTLVVTGGSREGGNHSLGFYSLDTQTQKLTALTDDLLPNSRDALLDRQGHIRLTLANSMRNEFPLSYEYFGPEGRTRKQPMNQTAGFAGFTVSPDNYFGARAIPLGFAEDPNLLYYAANLDRDTYGIYALDLAAGKRGSLSIENPVYDLIGPPVTGFPEDGSLVFDRFQHKLVGVRYSGAMRTTVWLKPELRALQAEFEKRFPGRSIEITDWDELEHRFIITTEGPADPGAFYVYDAPSNKLMEFARRSPWVDANHVHLTVPFSFPTKDGARISGLVTVPQQPRVKPIPMVILCPDVPWQRLRSDFQTELQALADMGFAVVQFSGRGAWGLGKKQRQTLTSGYDLAQIEDIMTTADNLGKIFNVSLRRIALMGRGHGGFIALRALQEHPEKFSCAIALDAPVNLGGWLEDLKWNDDDVLLPHLTRAWLGDAARLKAAPLTSAPDKITKPVLLLNYPGLDGAARRPSYLAARGFANKVRNRGATVEFIDLTTDYMHGLPAARAAVFDEIEGFLNTNVYNFKVKLQDLKVIDKEVQPR